MFYNGTNEWKDRLGLILLEERALSRPKAGRHGGRPSSVAGFLRVLLAHIGRPSKYEVCK